MTGHDTTFDDIAPARSANNSPPLGYRTYPSGTCGATGQGFTDPQWVLVGGSDTPVTLEGQVTSSKLATDDNPIDHHSRDRNFFVFPNEESAHLLANPGNFITGAGTNAVESKWSMRAPLSRPGRCLWPATACTWRVRTSGTAHTATFEQRFTHRGWS